VNTLVAFVELLLGLFPLTLADVTIVTAFWAATRLFPKFGERMETIFDAVMGTDPEYDHKHNTGYATTPHRWT